MASDAATAQGTAIAHTVALTGLRPQPVQVEVDLSAGLPGLHVSGCAASAVREACDRVRAAFANSRLVFPQRRLTVNLAPADLPKSGAGFDLAIAVGLLVASGQAAAPPPGWTLLGELGLDGALRAPLGVLPVALAAARAGSVLVVPVQARAEAAIAGGTIRTVGTLVEAVGALADPRPDAVQPVPAAAATRESIDLARVRGQPLGRYALEVAAAGRHNLLLSGPPGIGKTLLARALPGLLPRLGRDDALEVAEIQSLRRPVAGLPSEPPFVAVHHSASSAALVGGGTGVAMPGAVSLAHCGVLFLDELAEFRPAVLDMLRQPLEEGRVHLARARAVVEYPARCMVVAATNPCRCAWDGPDGTCVCPGGGKQRVSGPFLDRFDVRVSLPPVAVDDLLEGPVPEDSATVAARVATADGLARERNGGIPNSALVGASLDRIVPLGGPVGTALRRAVGRRLISVRGVDRIRRLARTIADLGGATTVGETEVHAALALRGL